MDKIADKRQIEELMHRTYASMDSGNSAFPGMSYEDGVRAVCEFILGGLGVTMDDVLPEPDEDD